MAIDLPVPPRDHRGRQRTSEPIVRANESSSSAASPPGVLAVVAQPGAAGSPAVTSQSQIGISDLDLKRGPPPGVLILDSHCCSGDQKRRTAAPARDGRTALATVRGSLRWVQSFGIGGAFFVLALAAFALCGLALAVVLTALKG